MIAAYLRCSSDLQDTERQRKAIEKAASIDVWFEDYAPRDQSDRRPQFQQMLTMIDGGLITAVYVDRQDRMGTRDAHEYGSFINRMRVAGCSLYDAAGNCLSGDDDVSILTTTLGSITSRREQQEKAHRTISSKSVKAKQGEYQGGYPPFGFDVACSAGWWVVYDGHFKRIRMPDGTRFDGKGNFPARNQGETLHLVVNKERAKVVRMIFDWYTNEDISPGKIAERLTQMEIDDCFNGWSKQRIYTSILQNPAYIGRPTWGKKSSARFQKAPTVQSEVQLDRIIDDQTWERAQEKIKRAKTGQKSPRKGLLWLRPLLYCGACGSGMHASMQWEAYFCGAYQQKQCRCHRTPHDKVLALLMDHLQTMSPKVARLLNEVKSGIEIDKASRFAPVLDAIYCEMISFNEAHGGALIKDYGKLYEQVVPKLKAEAEKIQAELDKKLEAFAELSPTLRKRAKGSLNQLERKLSVIEGQLIDMRDPLKRVETELENHQKQIMAAMATINGEAGGRRKLELVRKVVSKITCHHEYKGKKSFLQSISVDVRNDTRSGRNGVTNLLFQLLENA